MAHPAIEQPVLNQEEWAMIARLLEAKQRELLAEIRHTDKRAFREALHERLDLLESLLNRIAAASKSNAEG